MHRQSAGLLLRPVQRLTNVVFGPRLSQAMQTPRRPCRQAAGALRPRRRWDRRQLPPSRARPRGRTGPPGAPSSWRAQPLRAAACQCCRGCCFCFVRGVLAVAPFSGYGLEARSAGDGWKAVRKRESSAPRRRNPPASILQASPSGGTRLACQQWKSGDWPGFRSVRTASGRAPLERAICQRSRQRSCGLLRYSKVIRSCCGRSPAIAAVCLKPPERIRRASGASS